MNKLTITKKHKLIHKTQKHYFFIVKYISMNNIKCIDQKINNVVTTYLYKLCINKQTLLFKKYCFNVGIR